MAAGPRPARRLGPHLADPPLQQLSIGDDVTLVREYDNPADENAIAVITAGRTKVGYLAREVARPLLFQLMGRLDLITIWVTILLAIGLYVTGKVSKDRAVVFGFLIWIVGSLPALRTGYVAM